MSLSIIIPDSLESRLEEEAAHRGTKAPLLAVQILTETLNGDERGPSAEDVVAKIQSTPPNPASVGQAAGSLADALRSCMEEPELNLAEWNRKWAAVEAK